jgi:heterotetrameric sarcosine oxidase gamma subunit
MADRRLPFRGSTSEGQEVNLREVPVGYLTQLAGWNNFVPFSAELLRGSSLALAADYRIPWRGNDSVVWRIAPDRVLIRSNTPFVFASTTELVTLDLSQARVRLHLEGPGTPGLLSRLAAIDFSETSFPVGSFVQAGIHHVGVLIDRPGQLEFELFIPTTWAGSLVELIAAHLH